jgi:hypothetical protein
VLVIIAAVLVVLLGWDAAIGRGPLAPGSGFLQALHISSRPAHGTPAATSSKRSTTSTTTPGLGPRTYQMGDCVTWDLHAASDTIPTSVVPCSSPHVIEVVSKEQFTYNGTTYPDIAQWKQIYTATCAGPVTSYLGFAIDPAGRFFANALYPQAQALRAGERTLWCGISQSSPVAPFDAYFSGTVRGQSQQLLYPIGTCFSSVSSTQLSHPVACTAAHSTEVVGTTTLQGLTQLPQGAAAMYSAVGPDCRQLVTQYLGGPLPADREAGWLTLAQSSWNAGERSVQCTVASVDGTGNALNNLTASVAQAG